MPDSELCTAVSVHRHRLAPLVPSRTPISPARRQLSSSSPQPAAQLLRSMIAPGPCFSTARRRLWPPSMAPQRQPPRMGSSPPSTPPREVAQYEEALAAEAEAEAVEAAAESDDES